MVDAARTQVFAGFSWESLALVRLRCFLERKGTSPGVAYQRGGLPSCFSRCRFIMLGVQEGREREGEANGEIAGCTQSATVNSNANNSILFPARQQNQHSFTVGISNDSRGHECMHCAT